MDKISEIFNFDNTGEKIKNLTKWSCWITILLIWIAAPITLIVLLSEEPDLFWIPLVGAVVGPLFVWIGSWAMYAFGELVADTHAIRHRMYLTPEEKDMQDTERKVARENEIKAKQQVIEKAQREAEAMVQQGQKAEYWTCPQCKRENDKSKEECWHCGQKQCSNESAETAEKPNAINQAKRTTTEHASDNFWICSCQRENDNSRTECWHCGNKRPE